MDLVAPRNCGNRLSSVLTLSFLLSFAAVAAQAGITGTVVDENGAPLSHATVRAYAQETPQERAARAVAGKVDREPLAAATTGDDGAFRLDPKRPVVELIASAAERAWYIGDAADGDDAGTILLEKSKPYTGRVTADGKPVSGAIVMAGSLFTRSAADGTFSLPLSESGRGRVTILATDFAPFESNSALLDQSGEAKLTRGVTVRGRVMSADGKTPVAHAVVSIGAYSKGESGADGTFVIAHVPPTWRSLIAVAPAGTASTTRSGASAYDLRIHPPASVSGTVRDAKSGAPIAGMRVMLRSAVTENEAAITDAKGAFSFTGIASGDHGVIGFHPLYQLDGGGGMVRVAAGDRKTLAFPAVPLARVHGTVVDDDHKPVAAAIVSSPGSQETMRSAISSGKGEFTIRVNGPAGAPLMARKEGFLSAIATAEQVSSRALVLTLRRGFPLVATVVDEEKKPVANAWVSFAPTDNTPDGTSRPMIRCAGGACTTGNDGQVTVRLVPGTYSVNVGGPPVVMKNFPAQKLTEKSPAVTLQVERGVVVSGRVTYSDGSPVTEGAVSLRASAISASTRIDPSGTFTITNSPRGPVTLKVQMSAGGVAEDVIQEVTSKEVTAPASDVVLTMPPSGRITGTVVDANTRQPVTEFQIGTQRSFGRPATFNANDGSFTLEHVTAGKVDLTATAPGYVRGTVSAVEVADGKTTSNVEIRLDPAARVTGRATARDGSAVAGVYVMVVESAARTGAVTDSATTDANGEFKLMSVAPGERRIAFTKQGFLRQEKSVEASASRESTVDVVLDRGLEVRGRVVDESGQPVPNANVAAQAAGDGSGARSDSDGMFVVSGLRDLHYTVTARRQGFTESRVDDVVPGSAGPLTLTLRRGGTVTGHISNAPAGTGVMSVNLYGDRYGGSARADASGNFTISGVPDGNFTAEASVFVAGSSPRRTGRVPVSVSNGTSAPVELSFVDGVTVQGRVTVDGKPATGANVAFLPSQPSLPSGNSPVGADGTYSVAGLVTGDYRVNVNFAGNSMYSEKYSVTTSSVYDIDVRAGSLRGRVTDADSGAPLANAQVSIGNLDRKPVYVRPRSTDQDGVYAFDDVVEGKWRATVQKEGYRTETRDIVIAGASTTDLQLSKGAKTTLRLVDASDGRAVIGYVNAVDSSRKPAGAAQAHSDGSVDLWIAPGTYTVYASAQQYYADPTTVTAPATDVQIRMRRSGRVIVRWTRPGVSVVQLRSVPSASPAPGAGGSVAGSMTMRSQTGAFENVRPGQWTAQLLGPDNKPVAEQPVTVAEGQTATIAFP